VGGDVRFCVLAVLLAASGLCGCPSATPPQRGVVTKIERMTELLSGSQTAYVYVRLSDGTEVRIYCHNATPLNNCRGMKPGADVEVGPRMASVSLITVEELPEAPR